MRDKQIEEMARDIASTPIGTVKPNLTLTEMGEVYKGEFILRIAKHLYTAGYRKASEVAREIFEEIEGIMAYFPIYGHANTVIVNENDFAEIKKKYTEEVK